ncbi:MAG: dephospho-CoA kinase [Bacteroidota bacterium]|nr:dephospho-CoA kinase [Bacteroidota bacterium]
MGKTIQVGVTGGIGVGKTTVGQIFETLGAPIYKSDDRAKILMNSSDELKSQIIEAFGYDAYNRDKQLNRSYLATVVFNNPKKLQVLNSLVHPTVLEDYRNWFSEQNNVPYTIKEAALMFETDSHKSMDCIIVVTCPINLRIDRIVKRDHMKRDEVLKRIENQMSDKQRLEKAQYRVKNDGKQSIIKQTIDLHHKFLNLSKNA